MTICCDEFVTSRRTAEERLENNFVKQGDNEISVEAGAPFIVWDTQVESFAFYLLYQRTPPVQSAFSLLAILTATVV